MQEVSAAQAGLRTEVRETMPRERPLNRNRATMRTRVQTDSHGRAAGEVYVSALVSYISWASQAKPSYINNIVGSKIDLLILNDILASVVHFEILLPAHTRQKSQRRSIGTYFWLVGPV